LVKGKIVRELNKKECDAVAGGLEPIYVYADAPSLPSFYWDYDPPGFPYYSSSPVSGGGGGGAAKPPPAGAGAGTTTGLGSGIDDIIHLSPIMSSELANIESWGYTFVADGKSYTDYTTHQIHVDTSLPTQDMMGALAHEFGHAMFEHYYGLPQYTLSQSDYVAGWMNNEGYAQVNAIRITQDMPGGTNVIKLEGTSAAQIQSEYSAYQTAGQHYETDPTFPERGVDMLIYQGHAVGVTLNGETAIVNSDGTTVNYNQMYSNAWAANHH
jgi:hypothetical protein